MAGGTYVGDFCLLYHIFSHAGTLIPQVCLFLKGFVAETFFFAICKNQDGFEGQRF